MVFFIEDDHLIEKCNTICDKVSADIYIKKEFDNESVYNKEYLKKKKKSYVDEVTGFMLKKFQG